jgi:hypothetical protein
MNIIYRAVSSVALGGDFEVVREPRMDLAIVPWLEYRCALCLARSILIRGEGDCRINWATGWQFLRLITQLAPTPPDVTLSLEFVLTAFGGCKLVFKFSFTFDGDNNSGGSRPPFLMLLTFGVVFVSEVRSFFETELLAKVFVAVLGDDSLGFC